MNPYKLINEKELLVAFDNFFNSITDMEGQVAFERLLSLGLSEEEVLIGIEAGCRVIAEENGTLVAVENRIREFRSPSN